MKINKVLPPSIIENDSLNNILKAFMIANKEIIESKQHKTIIRASDIKYIREILWYLR